MKSNNFSRGVLIFFSLLITLVSFGQTSYSEPLKDKKTLIISTDQLDFRQMEYLDIENSAISLMSAKTARGNGSSSESQFMTIATGRRVTVEEEQFMGVYEEGEGLTTAYFFNILYRLNQDYEDFIDKFKFLGEIFHDNGMKTAYIGGDSSILLAADKEGKVDYGEIYVPENYEDLNKLVGDLSSKANLTVLSYTIEDNYEKLNDLKKLTETFDGTVYIIPKMISGDIVVRNNTTIKPIMIKGIGSGTLESNTTKRFGLVSNLDIMPTILSDYGIEYEGEVGKPLVASNEVESKDKDEPSIIEKIQYAFTKYMNLTSVKYSFNAIVIYIQVFIILLYFITGKVYPKIKFILYIPLYSILLSLIFGNFLSQFHRDIYVYSILGFALLLSIITDFFIKHKESGKRIIDRENYSIEKLSVVTFFLIVFSIIFLPEQVYSSFVGYNNLVSGGRFFGFNNDIMGTLVGTFMLSYFYLRKNKPKRTKQAITVVGIAVLLIALSGKFGSNFGGLVTALVLSLVLIYNEFLTKISTKKKIIAGIAVLAMLIVGVVIMTRGDGNHISEFINRVRLYGMEEFIYMVSRKFYQVFANTKKMPWILAIIIQLTFLLKMLYNVKGKNRFKNMLKLFIFISVVALLTNDTGVVALVYMNTILITSTLLKMANKEI